MFPLHCRSIYEKNPITTKIINPSTTSIHSIVTSLKKLQIGKNNNTKWQIHNKNEKTKIIIELTVVTLVTE